MASEPRSLPYNVEIEQALLGCVIADNTLLDEVRDAIAADDFYDPLHQRIWAAAELYYGRDEAVTLLTLRSAMADDAGLKEVGGHAYFLNLVRMAPPVPNVKEYARIISALAVRRQIIGLGESFMDAAYSSAADRDPMEILDGFEAAARGVVEARAQPEGPVTWFEAGKFVMDRVEAPKEAREGELTPFGIRCVDAEIGGMGAGDLIILAGRPGMGKTAVAVAIAHSVARPPAQINLDLNESRPPQKPGGVFMVSLEMKHDALLERGLSMRAFSKGARVTYQSIRLNRLQDWGKDALARALTDDGEIPFLIDHRRGQTVAQIGIRARRAQAQMRKEGIPLRLVVVDHLGLIEPEGNYIGNRVAEMTAITKALKGLAGQLGVPVLALSQLSRRVEEREDKRPYLSDLRESGSIEQDADAVLLLHRPEYYLAKSEPPTGEGSKAVEKHTNWQTLMDRHRHKLEIHVAKNRHGAETSVTVTCDLAFNWIGDSA